MPRETLEETKRNLLEGYLHGHGNEQISFRGNSARSRGNKRALMKYKVMLRLSEEGYSVSVAGLPGCWSQGATEQKAIENMTDAIKEYLAAVDDLFPDSDVREIEMV